MSDPKQKREYLRVIYIGGGVVFALYLILSLGLEILHLVETNKQLMRFVLFVFFLVALFIFGRFIAPHFFRKIDEKYKHNKNDDVV